MKKIRGKPLTLVAVLFLVILLIFIGKIFFTGNVILSEDPKAYMVVDLTKQGASAISYLSTPPSSGWTDEYKTTKLVLRKIPAGTFTMGTNGESGQLQTDIDEGPAHQVTISKDFYLGIFEITNGQWNQVMNRGSGDSYPKANIDWTEVRGGSWPESSWPGNPSSASFAGRLSSKIGLKFDLPTEAQWEYACRAGTKTGTSSALAPDSEGWFFGSAGGGSPHKVGTKNPNTWGLYDMQGNVYENILDYITLSYGSSSSITDPKGAASSEYSRGQRVIRGGSFNNGPSDARCADRMQNYESDSQSSSIGAGRIAVPVPDTNTPRTTQSTYMIIDISGGTTATTYPVTYSDTVPTGGWTDEYKTTKLVLRKIPAGTFTMGSPTNQPGRRTAIPADSGETEHRVTISKDFYIGVFKITQKQYELVMGNNPSNANIRGNLYPVISSGWNNARGGSWPETNWPGRPSSSSFAGKLSAKTGMRFDLPTEAMWEYSCKAGTTTGLNNGKELVNIVNPGNDMAGNMDYDPNAVNICVGGFNVNTLVGTKQPNNWGLYDFSCNSAEWVLDWTSTAWHLDETTQSQTDPKGVTMETAQSWHSEGKPVRMIKNDISQGLGGARCADKSIHVWEGYDVMPDHPEVHGPSFRIAMQAPQATNPIPTNMVLIPDGSFSMGGTGIIQENNWNTPAHQVTLSKFYMDKYEVTGELWNEVIEYGLQHGYDFSFFYGEAFSYNSYPRNKKPVEGIPWHIALIWTNARSEMEGLTPAYYTSSSKTSVLKKVSSPTMPLTNSQVKWDATGYRLPTEAEWEYAARGGLSGKAYPWGDELDLTKGNICPIANSDACLSNPLADVGSYPANGFGLFDMVGNVAEHVWDCQGYYSSSSQTNPKNDLYGDSSYCQRIKRGGAVTESYGYTQVAYRAQEWPERGAHYRKGVGFRTIRKYVAPGVCTEADWTSSVSPSVCPASQEQRVTWTLNRDCTGGVSHLSTETRRCTYNIPQEEQDSDGDGIKNSLDRCSNTAREIRVNSKGCPLPNLGTFSSSYIGSLDLNEVSNFELRSEQASIIFNRPVKLVRFGDTLNISRYVMLERNKIAIDSARLSELNVPATLYFFENNLTDPVVLVNGILCEFCNLTKDSGIVSVEVPHFTSYELVERSYYEEFIKPKPVEEPVEEVICYSSWNCSVWTNCSNETQTRICRDANNCNSTSGKPSESQGCFMPVCTPNWQCTDWPEKGCDSGKPFVVRRCTDRNGCNSSAGKPNEREICEENDSDGKTVLIVLLILFILLAIGGIIYYYLEFIRQKKIPEKVIRPAPPLRRMVYPPSRNFRNSGRRMPPYS